MSNEYFGYIYKFTNLNTGLIYVGKREKSTFDESYYGSGKLWTQSIEGLDLSKCVKREVLYWGTSRQDLNEKEIYWISKLNATDKSVGYNIHRGGQGGNSLGDTQLWSELHQGERNGRYHREVSEETRKKISEANKGKVRSEEFKLNVSRTQKGRKKPDGFAEKCSKIQKGKIVSESTKNKLRALNTGENNPSYGKHWYNNGVINKKFNENEIPEGFVRGTLRKGIKTGKNNIAGKKWYNNGITEVLTTECPTGFTEGRLKSISNKISNSKRGAV